MLFLPTVILNGSLWGQCDSIYTAFAVLGLYLALDERPWLSVCCIALSFAFKLQAVFILPVYAVLLFTGRIRLRHIAAFPAAYVLAVLPAVLLGRPFLETLTLYFSQAGTVGDALNYNAPSIFSLLPNIQDAAKWSKPAVLWSFGFVALVLGAAAARRTAAGDKTVLAAAVLFAVGIPFLLPHMHDRYFYCADVLSMVLAFAVPQMLGLPLLVELGSFLSYYAYLRLRYLLPPAAGGWFMAAAFLAAGVCFAISLSSVKKSAVLRR